MQNLIFFVFQGDSIICIVGSYFDHILLISWCSIYASTVVKYLVMYIQKFVLLIQTQDLLEDNFSLIIEDIPCLAKVVLLYFGTKWNVTWWFFYKVYYEFSDSLYHPNTFEQIFIFTLLNITFSKISLLKLSELSKATQP